jgi:hypothetical protein
MNAVRRLSPIAGIATALLLFEIVLRHIFFGTATWDARIGWVYYNTELRHHIFEGSATSHWDRRGIREIPGELPRGPAILVIGNSVTQAAQVGDAEVYTALLQKRVALPVLNVGHDAQSLADDVVAASRRLSTLPIAWTIVQFGPLDFEERPVQRDRAGLKLANARLVAQPGEVHFGRFAPVTQWLHRHSGLVNLGLLRFEVLRQSPMPPFFRAADPRPVVSPVDYGPVELKLDALRDAYGGRVTMFIVPEFLQPETSMERRFTKWCESTGTSCVDLRLIFEDFRKRGRAPTGFSNSNFGFGHLNEQGHIASANLLAAEIERLRSRGLF